MKQLELAIAWRYLRSRSASRLLSFISVIAIVGVLVGVSALIVIIGVMNGLQADLRDKILIGSPDIRVLNYGEELKMGDWRETLAKVRKQPGIVAAAPFVLSQGLVNAGRTYQVGAMVVGIEPAPAPGQDVTPIRKYAIEGRGDFRFRTIDGHGSGVVIGKRLAEQLNVLPGDSVTLISGSNLQMNDVTGLPVPRFFRYEVTGVFETGMYEYDNTFIYLPLESAKSFAGLGNAVSGIEARTADRWSANEVAHTLGQSLGSFRVLDWQEQNSGLFQALKLEKFAMGVILLLIVVVAAFNIVSTLTMVVKDKTREIGILKAMGLPSRSIRRIFLAQGLVIGLVGTGIGLVVGLVAALAIDRGHLISLDPSVYFIDHLPVALEVLDVLWIVLASVAIAVAATVYPSLQAARLYPVEAIRAE
ncbi:MAG: lipoprotein-releasing ABC transporter permease subunit [Gemmatimonadaceae bacterium]